MEPVQEGGLLVGVRPHEDLSGRIRIHPIRILVPIGLESASATALGYASGLALKFGSELVIVYAFDDPECRNAARIEGQLWKWLSSIRTRHPAARLFLRAGIVCEQVKAVAKAVGAGLIVMSRDYYSRFLSWSAREEAGVLAIPGMPCPVALVDVPDSAIESLGPEMAVALDFGTVLGVPAVPKERPKPMPRHAVGPPAARARLRGSRSRLHRARFRGHHCLVPAG